MSLPPPQSFVLPPAGLPPLPLLWWPDFLPHGESDALFAALHAEVAWEQRSINFGGRRVAVPRRVAWYGEEAYRYGGFIHPPAALPASLLALIGRLAATLAPHLPALPRFNSVLLNLYRDGGDSMSFHADNEAQLGPEPVIASLSLGATRSFLLRPRKGGPRLAGRLSHGSLLVMHGNSQTDWLHAVPKEPCAGARINLTFRHTAALAPRGAPARRAASR